MGAVLPLTKRYSCAILVDEDAREPEPHLCCPWGFTRTPGALFFEMMLKDRRPVESKKNDTSAKLTISWFYIFFNTFFDNYTLFCQLHLAKTKQMFYNLKQGCHFYTVFFVFVLDSSFHGRNLQRWAGGFFFTVFSA